MSQSNAGNVKKKSTRTFANAQIKHCLLILNFVACVTALKKREKKTGANQSTILGIKV